MELTPDFLDFSIERNGITLYSRLRPRAADAFSFFTSSQQDSTPEPRLQSAAPCPSGTNPGKFFKKGLENGKKS